FSSRSIIHGGLVGLQPGIDKRPGFVARGAVAEAVRHAALSECRKRGKKPQDHPCAHTTHGDCPAAFGCVNCLVELLGTIMVLFEDHLAALPCSEHPAMRFLGAPRILPNPSIG